MKFVVFKFLVVISLELKTLSSVLKCTGSLLLPSRSTTTGMLLLIGLPRRDAS